MGLRGIREELPHLFTLHHAFCLFLTIVFYVTKVVAPICHLIYGNEVRCKIDNVNLKKCIYFIFYQF